MEKAERRQDEEERRENEKDVGNPSSGGMYAPTPCISECSAARLAMLKVMRQDCLVPFFISNLELCALDAV